MHRESGDVGSLGASRSGHVLRGFDAKNHRLVNNVDAKQAVERAV